MKFLTLTFLSCLCIVGASFSQNRRPYFENGKLNSPMVATFVPPIGNELSQNRGQLPTSLVDVLSPPQYTQWQSQFHGQIPSSFSKINSQIHNVQLSRPIVQQTPSSPSLNEFQVVKRPFYNDRYPFTPPTIKYRIGVVSDLDKNSMDNKTLKSGEVPTNWDAFLKEGHLSIQFNPRNPQLSSVTVDWNKDKIIKLRSGFNYASRGMELSTLNIFNGKVYTCDDKTGIVYELPLTNSLLVDPIPWAILADGNFTGPEGFKCEWGTIKDQHLFIGGQGVSIPNTNNNSTLKNHQKFVKKISPSGEVTHLDWRDNFDKMAQALDIKYPGYVAHESGGWSEALQKWVFMPRRISKVEYKEETDKNSGSNVVILADEAFDNVQVSRIGSITPSRGFSSFKWIPGTDDQILVALKTVETKEKGGESYIMAFTLDGTILLKETKFADQKFEGIEFI